MNVYIIQVSLLNGISEINQLFDDILIIWTSTCVYIQCPPLILAPLVNMSKGGCENKSALFILFIFRSKKITKFQPIIEVKQLKVGGKSHCEINAFSSSCWTQLWHPIIATSFSQDNSSEFSPIMPEEFGEHLIRDQRPFSSSRISPDPSDSQLHVSTSSLQFTSLIFYRVQVRELKWP